VKLAVGIQLPGLNKKYKWQASIGQMRLNKGKPAGMPVSKTVILSWSGEIIQFGDRVGHNTKR